VTALFRAHPRHARCAAGSSLEGHISALAGGISIDMRELNQFLTAGSGASCPRDQGEHLRADRTGDRRLSGRAERLAPGQVCTLGTSAVGA
jgi:hypothetical protein